MISENASVAMNRKRMIPLLTVGLVLLGVVIGCEHSPQIRSTYDKIPFTHSLRTEYNLTPPEIKRLQFYVSHPLQRRHVSTSGKYEITKGTLITKAGQDIQEVVVNRGTPGVAVDVREPDIRISFEEKFSFRFVRGIGAQSDVYVLGLTTNEQGQSVVRYGGASFIPERNSQLAHLLIKKEDLTEMVNKRRVLPGRRLRD